MCFQLVYLILRYGIIPVFFSFIIIPIDIALKQPILQNISFWLFLIGESVFTGIIGNNLYIYFAKKKISRGIIHLPPS